MTIPTGMAIYFLVWWITLFAILPWGIRSQHEGDGYAQGTDPGAPTIPGLGRKLIWTTIVSAIVFAASVYLYVEKIVTLDSLATLFGLLPSWE
jgi:predicted secreted protein